METHMNKKLKILLVLLALLVVAIFVAFLASYAFNPPPPQEFPFRHVPVPQVNPADIELFYVARTVVSTINIGLLVALLATYASIYMKTRSEFTIGLIIFAIVFLMKDITSSPLVIERFGFGLFGLGPFALLPDLFELAALSVLLYLSIKY